MNEADLSKLGPEGDRYILLCVVNAVSSNYFIVANVGHAQMAAVLIDKRTAEVVWSNKADRHRLMESGLIFVLLVNQKAFATYTALRDLFKTLPEKQ